MKNMMKLKKIKKRAIEFFFGKPKLIIDIEKFKESCIALELDIRRENDAIVNAGVDAQFRYFNKEIHHLRPEFKSPSTKKVDKLTKKLSRKI